MTIYDCTREPLLLPTDQSINYVYEQSSFAYALTSDDLTNVDSRCFPYTISLQYSADLGSTYTDVDTNALPSWIASFT